MRRWIESIEKRKGKGEQSASVLNEHGRITTVPRGDVRPRAVALVDFRYRG